MSTLTNKLANESYENVLTAITRVSGLYSCDVENDGQEIIVTRRGGDSTVKFVRGKKSWTVSWTAGNAGGRVAHDIAAKFLNIVEMRLG